MEIKNNGTSGKGYVVFRGEKPLVERGQAMTCLT
jgi:hypothetical protein